MASNTIDNLAVPTTTESDIAIYQVHGKTGKINMLLFNNGEKNSVAGEGGMLEGSELEFKVYESADRDTWTEISGGWIAVAPGGSEDAAVITQQPWLKVTGRGTTSGGYCRIDLQWRGDPYFGQVDISLMGKSGYGRDGAGDGSLGEAVYTADVWPD